MGSRSFEGLTMRVLLLGAAGMLGHKLYQQYQERFDVYATTRKPFSAYTQYRLFDEERIISGVEAFDFDAVTKAIADVKPDVVINCIGIIKQLKSAKDPIISLTLNSLFPHRVANLCRAAGIRFIHISTDCVFNGRKGLYTEDDPSDAEDLYGRTKFLGEVDYPGCLTLRTSIIGRELNTTSGLIGWFLSNQGGKIRGFRKAIYTGFTTAALSDIVADVLEKHPNLSGMYQVSSKPINKYDLLLLARDAFRVDIEIEPDDDFVLDRSLDSSRFRAEAGFTPPTWKQMIQSMADDPTPYGNW
jgi:dTDP-4-dehydrorhamnose reductase